VSDNKKQERANFIAQYEILFAYGGGVGDWNFKQYVLNTMLRYE
jgi:hypothetical protein